MADAIVQAPKTPRRLNMKASNRLMFFLLLSPALIMVAVFVLYPLCTMVFYSFFDWNGLGPLGKASLDNYVQTLKPVPENYFWNALKNNGIVIVFSILVQLPIAFMLAIIISRKNTKLMVFFRAICFLPYVLSEIITGTLWTFIFHPRHGLVFSIIKGISPGTEYTGLLASQDTVFIAILIVIFWKYFGLHLIIYIAGFQVIPTDFYEAAKIDGANGPQILRHITLPMMGPAIQMSLFFCIIGSLQLFDVVWAMGQGDPVHAGETAVVFLYKYGIRTFQIGYGAAITVIIFVICLIFNIFYQKLIKEE
jgi:raffinose/stachyose/melibiose transport system permease protein